MKKGQEDGKNGVTKAEREIDEREEARQKKSETAISKEQDGCREDISIYPYIYRFFFLGGEGSFLYSERKVDERYTEDKRN